MNETVAPGGCPDQSSPTTAAAVAGAHAHAHAHGLDHDHDVPGHPHHEHHALRETADAQRRVMLAAGLTATFMVAEFIGGLLSGSLALIADAAHMLTDTGALMLAWVGYKLAERPADPERSYGFARMKVLAAFANGLLLVLLAIWITWEAVARLLQPVDISGGVMLMIAIAGLGVNLVSFGILHGGERSDLNLRGALWHVAGDMMGSAAAIAAAGCVLIFNWTAADPLLSILVAGLAAWGGVRIVRQSGHILLEGTPPGLSAEAIAADLKAHVPGVAAVSHIHAWALTESRPLVTLEVTLLPGANAELVRRAVKERLAHTFGASHATVEVIA